MGDITADFVSLLFYGGGGKGGVIPKWKTLRSWNLVIEWLVSSRRTKNKDILADALGHQGQCCSGRCLTFSSLEKDPDL